MNKPMDRHLLRKLGKEAYKKLVKGTPKSKRISFSQAWPALKASLEEQHKEQLNPVATTDENLSAVDAMIEQVVEPAEKAAPPIET